MSVSHSHPTGTHAHPELGFLRKYIFSEDHKIIGIQFLFSGMIFFLIGGTLALLVRLQVGYPKGTIPHVGHWFPASWGGRMSPDFYAMIFSMHATIMIFFVIIPLLTGAFGNFCIPLMIGARDMAFPKLNMMSYWFMWPAFAVILSSFFVDGGAAASGWTSYPLLASATMSAGEGFQSPASPHSGHGQICWLVALAFVGISSMMGSVNYMTTIINLRAPGMTMFRMPLTVWAMFITAILQAMALPVLTVALILQLLDKTINTTFFLPPGGMAFGNWHTGSGRRTDAVVAASVLVLLASGRVHHRADHAGLPAAPPRCCSRWSASTPTASRSPISLVAGMGFTLVGLLAAVARRQLSAAAARRRR